MMQGVKMRSTLRCPSTSSCARPKVPVSWANGLIGQLQGPLPKGPRETGGAPGHSPEVGSIPHPSWDPILGYINGQYEQYLQEEILITRQRHIPDTRVHCCVYFVAPTGHR